MSEDAVANILQAARRCYLSGGIMQTGMAEVAQAAGIARSTLYRYFPGRDALLVATVRREMEVFNAAIQRRLAQYEEPADVIVEGLLIAIRELPRQPLLRAVFVADGDARARRKIWSSQIIIDFGEDLMQGVLLPAQQAGALQDRVRPEVMLEWIYRVLLSFLTLPSNWVRDDQELRATLHALLVPVVLRLD
jgi:TetR/AcrR family transcriptional regulator